jgi:acetone monooxygenase
MDQAEIKSRESNGTKTLDAVVIGAGIAGLYQLHRMRLLGLKVRAFEAGSGVGGTWYWNRYPGARFDSQVEVYQYWFSEDLYKAWKPSERFPAQPETEQWLNFVADRFDLKKDIQFSTRIESATYREKDGRWDVVTSDGERIDTQYLLACCGMLSAPLNDRFPGQSTFNVQRSDYPYRPLAERGNRSQRQAGRRGGHRSHRHPGDPDHRIRSRVDEGVRAHAAICCAHEEPEIFASGLGSLE